MHIIFVPFFLLDHSHRQFVNDEFYMGVIIITLQNYFQQDAMTHDTPAMSNL